ncbi:MAG TPA: hypothetical protein VFL46_06045, partial [Phycicoccus sp.]|nr:hypothetical protein [Phycicoccus sp.]
SPDGRLIAVGRMDGQLGLASVDTGNWVLEPRKVYAGPVDGVEFSPDGSLLVTSGNDGRIRLWDGRSGASRGSVRAVPAGVRSFVTFREDGRALMVAGSDGSVRRWDLRIETWARLACARAGRDLTTEEWVDIFGEDQPYRRTCPTT